MPAAWPLTTSAYVFWPNATIPFYIEKDHYDQDQVISIMQSISLFASKTCLKVRPVLARPSGNDHVLIIENPTGTKKCTVLSDPHSIDEPHSLIMGYNCLKSPHFEMLLMRALGFPFEHNRAIRYEYITVQLENVEPAFVELFTKETLLPQELRDLPYDYNSVMHFSERDYSKNGHRTILFNDKNVKQVRNGLTPNDLKKIEIVYGPECRKRERNMQIDNCQNIGQLRRKRNVDIPVKPKHSLRVNPNITPPPDKLDEHDADDKHDKNRASDKHEAVDRKDNDKLTDKKDRVEDKDRKDKGKDDGKLASPHFRVEDDAEEAGYADAVVKSLEIESEVEDLVEQVHRVAAAALEKARAKYCNKTKPALRTEPTMEKPKNKNLLAIIDDTASYAKGLVDKATANLTEFCASSKSIADYQRSSCPFFDKSRCPKSYKSTKSGPVKYSTQHRPLIRQSTKHQGFVAKNIYEKMLRLRNTSNSELTDTDGLTTPQTPEKKEETTEFPVSKSDLRMGTRLVFEKKSIYVANERRKRHANGTEITGDKVENSKANVTVERAAADDKLTTRQIMVEVVTEEYKNDTDLDLKSAKIIKRRSQHFREDDYHDAPPSRLDRARDDEGKGTVISDDDEPGFRKKKIRPTSSEEDRGRDQKKGRGRNRESNSERDSERGRESTGRGRGRGSINREDSERGRERERDTKDDMRDSDRGRGRDKKRDRFDDRDDVDRFSGKNKGNKYDKYASEEKPKRSDEEDMPKKKSKTNGRIKGKKDSAEIDRFSNEEPEEKPKKLKLKPKPSISSSGSERKVPHTLKLSKRNREFYDERKWPDGLVRYVIKQGDFDIEDVRQRIAEVNDILKKRTCVKLQEMKEEDAENYEDFLVLDNSPDYVTGRVGGKQNLKKKVVPKNSSDGAEPTTLLGHCQDAKARKKIKSTEV